MAKVWLLSLVLLVVLTGFVAADGNSSNSTTATTCYDSDGGFNPYVMGTYHTCHSDGWCTLDRSDVCLSANTLREAYCQNDIAVENFSVFCPYGCSDGACNQNSTNSINNNVTTNSSNCRVLWYFDNEHRYCQQREFCGLYMYLGLQTFGTNEQCNAALNPSNGTTTCNTPNCPGAYIPPNVGVGPNGCPIYVCPQINTTCASPTCAGAYKTDVDSNGCIIYTCPTITNQVTCLFVNSASQQQCYTSNVAKAQCSGTTECTTDITAPKGERVTWKSTCGGYAYTIMGAQDEFGNNKYAKFDCTQGILNSTTTEPQPTNSSQSVETWFRNAYWKCQDGSEFNEGGDTSCNPYSLWKTYALDSCSQIVKTPTTSGVVSAFSLTNICYPVEGPTNTSTEANSTQTPSVYKCKADYDCPQINYNCPEGKKCPTPPIFKCVNNICVNSNPTPTNTSLPVICKDSCPSDSKCYPFGYRKASNYCSDTGSFITQLNGNEKCSNNFECSSNVCVNNQCISQGLIDKILNWFKRLFGG